MKNKLLMISILFLPASLFSQSGEGIKTEARKGKNAILFAFDGFNLSSFNGGFGWKKWTSNTLEMNASFKVVFSKDTKQETNELNGSESTEGSFELRFGLNRHLRTVDRISPYVGGQIGFSYEEVENKVIPKTALFYYDFPYNYRNETKRSSNSFSLQIVFGVEYFLKNNISLSGQYSLGGYYRLGKEKTISNIVDDTQDISGIYFGIRSSSLILSIYL